MDCDGENCERCGGRGHFKLTGCLRKHTDDMAWAAIETAHLIEKSAGWPSGGGWMNEPQALVDAVRCVWNLEATLKANLK